MFSFDFQHKNKTGKSSSNAVDSRSALLQSIQKGAKLKKTTTVDKSGPAIAGRIANSNSSSNNNNSSTNLNAPSRPPPPTNINAQMPKLGGIFGGMTEMPKLKPVGARSMCESCALISGAHSCANESCFLIIEKNL